jgi:hypothetical protein
MGQVFFEYFGFPCQFSIQQRVSIRFHSSSGAGTVCHIVTNVKSTLSLNPNQEIKKNIYIYTKSFLTPNAVVHLSCYGYVAHDCFALWVSYHNNSLQPSLLKTLLLVYFHGAIKTCMYSARKGEMIG